MTWRDDPIVLAARKVAHATETLDDEDVSEARDELIAAVEDLQQPELPVYVSHGLEPSEARAGYRIGEKA